MGQIKIIDILQQLILRFVSAIPNIVAAITVAIIGMVLAKAVAKVVQTVLRTIGLDKLAEQLNNIDFFAQYNIKIVPSQIFSQVLYYMLLLIFLIASTDLLGMPAVSQLISDLINFIPNLVSAGIVMILGIFLADIIKTIVLTTCQSLGIPSAKLIANFIFYFVFVTTIISALSQAKIDTSFIKANLSIILGGGVAAFALGYGLASRDMMANFLASFYVKSKFQIGELLIVDGAEGVIIEMDSTSLVLQTADREIILPLSMLTSKRVDVMTNTLITEGKSETLPKDKM